MPIKLQILDHGAGLLIEGSGHVNEAEYLHFFRTHLSSGAIASQTQKYSLTDWSQVTEAKISNAAIQEVAALSREVLIQNPQIVMAFVAHDDLLFGLTRMFELSTSQPDSLMRVFHQRSEAESWVRAEVKARFGAEDLTFS